MSEPVSSAIADQTLDDLLVLATFVNGSDASVPAVPGLPGLSKAALAISCQRLARQSALVVSPRSRHGFRPSLIGEARIRRFLNSQVGSARPAPLEREIEVRRILLRGLDGDSRLTHETRMCAELVVMRDGLFRCAHAELCAGRGCPFEAFQSVESIDRALVSLLPHLQ